MVGAKESQNGFFKENGWGQWEKLQMRQNEATQREIERETKRERHRIIFFEFPTSLWLSTTRNFNYLQLHSPSETPIDFNRHHHIASEDDKLLSFAEAFHFYLNMETCSRAASSIIIPMLFLAVSRD